MLLCIPGGDVRVTVWSLHDLRFTSDTFADRRKLGWLVLEGVVGIGTESALKHCCNKSTVESDFWDSQVRTVCLPICRPCRCSRHPLLVGGINCCRFVGCRFQRASAYLSDRQVGSHTVALFWWIQRLSINEYGLGEEKTKTKEKGKSHGRIYQ